MPLSTGQVDTSIYQNIANPLDTVGKVAGLQNTLNQNRLFQQQFQSNQAASKLFKDAVDPQTGKLDVQKFQGLLASDPNLSYGVGPVIQQSQEMQLKQLGIDQSKIDLMQKRQGAWSTALGTLMAKPNPTQKDIIQAAASLQNGGFGAPEIIQTITDPNDPLPQDPAGIKDWLTRHYTRGLTELGQFNALLGNPQTVNQGNQQTPMAISPLGGARTLGASIPTQMSPGESSSPVEVTMPDGSKRLIPKSQFAAQTGAAGAPGAPPAAPGTPPQPQGAPAQEGGPGIPSAISPAAQAAATAVGNQSGESLSTLRNDVAGTPARIFTLQKALTGLQGSNTGPGTNTVNNIKSFLLAQGGELATILPGVDPNKIKNFDEANKYLTQYAMAQSSMLGQGTNEKLATALTGNASTSISNMAAQDVVKANIGLERMKQAQAAAFDGSGQPPENYSKWAAQWARTADPRAYVVDLMKPADRLKMLNDMKPSEKRKFLDSLKSGINSGIVSLQDLAGGK